MTRMGLGISVVLVLLAWLVWGGQAAIATGVFALVATAIQVAAGRLMRGQQDAPLRQFLARHGAGMGLRLAGVVLLGTAALVRPDWFPPLPAALGFLGVLIPLLFLDLRQVR